MVHTGPAQIMDAGIALAQGVRPGDVDVSAGVIRKLPALPDQRARRDFVLAPACAPCLGLRRQILTAGLGLHLRTALRTHPITKLSGPPGRPREASAALTLVDARSLKATDDCFQTLRVVDHSPVVRALAC